MHIPVSPAMFKQTLLTNVQFLKRTEDLIFLDIFITKGLLFSGEEVWKR